MHTLENLEAYLLDLLISVGLLLKSNVIHSFSLGLRCSGESYLGRVTLDFDDMLCYRRVDGNVSRHFRF